MATAIRGLAEVVLMVQDVAAAVHFYQDVLGMEVISPPQMQGPKFLRVGPPRDGVPAQMVLVPRPADAPPLPADRRRLRVQLARAASVHRVRRELLLLVLAGRGHRRL